MYLGGMDKLLKDIETFLADTGLSEHRFGILAAKNGRIVPRLRAGGRVWPETEMQIRVWLKTDGEARRKRKAVVK